MSLDKQKFVRQVSSNRSLLNRLATDPKTVLAEFGFKITDSLARTVMNQASTLLKQRLSPEVISGEIYETLWNGKDKPIPARGI